MALRAGAFPEKLGHSACSQPACAGKDWCITHPIGQRCTDDQPTIKGRTSANFGYSKPLFACVHRTFGDQFIAPARAIFFWTQRPLTEKKSTHLNADKIKMLAKLKAIGAEFSTTLVGEVFYREFANRRQLGSYVGLASSPFCSGSLDRDQGISKAGNPKARVMMIELAWTWLRYQPESALSRWFRERVGNLKGRPRRIAIVAMARKLLVALWRYLQTGVVPTGAELKAQSN